MGPDRWHDPTSGRVPCRSELTDLRPRAPAPPRGFRKITNLVEFSASLAISRNALTGVTFLAMITECTPRIEGRSALVAACRRRGVSRRR